MEVDRYWIWNRVDPPYKVYDLMEWGQEFSKHSRRVAQTFFPNDGDKEVRVSTVFLGIDHSWGNNAQPILWETMIFGGEHDEFQQRYHCEQDAMNGHLVACDLVVTSMISKQWADNKDRDTTNATSRSNSNTVRISKAKTDSD